MKLNCSQENYLLRNNQIHLKLADQLICGNIFSKSLNLNLLNLKYTLYQIESIVLLI